jgi:hypothetical protein
MMAEGDEAARKLAELKIAILATNLSGVIATEFTEEVCPASVFSSAPLSRTRTLMVLSLLA